MITFLERLDPFLRWIGEASLQVAVLGVVLLAVEGTCWRWLSARSRVWLWSLVLVRLVLPPLPVPEGAAIVADAKLMSRLAPRAIADESESKANEDLAARSSADRREREVVAFPKLPPIGSPSPIAEVPEPRSIAPSMEQAGESSANPSGTLSLVMLWAAGFLFVLLRTVARERRFRLRLREAATCRDPELLAEIESAANAIGLRRSVEVRLTDAAAGPATTGIRRARLLLPPDFTTTNDYAARRCILLHELAHLRHRDALADAGLVLLRAAFWFHPVVHVALRRLHQAREERRDDEALSVEGAPPPASYAYTLLSALERGQTERSIPALAFLRGHEWRRRLTMIQNHGKCSRLTRVASGFALAGIGAGVLLGASTSNFVPPSALTEPRAATSAGLDRIRVEGYAQWPSWREDLERTLTRVLPELKLEDLTRRDALSSVSFLASLNVVLDPNLDPAYLDEPVDLVARSVIVRDALDLLLVPTQALGFECFDGGVRIAPRESLKPETETRFYSLAPFLENISDSDARHDVFESLIGILRSYADPDRSVHFDEGTWSLGTYRDLLVLNADRAMHDATKSLLERLLGPIDECAKEAARNHPYDESIEHAFATRISVDTDDQSLRDVVASISDRVGVSILVNESWFEERVQIHMNDAPTRAVLTAIGRQVRLHPVARSGVIFLAEVPDATVEMYEIGGLVPEDGDARGEAIDSLYDVIRSQIDPSSWDNYPHFSFSILGSRMIVRQTPANQMQLRGMLGALEKALGSAD